MNSKVREENGAWWVRDRYKLPDLGPYRSEKEARQAWAEDVSARIRAKLARKRG